MELSRRISATAGRTSPRYEAAIATVTSDVQRALGSANTKNAKAELLRGGETNDVSDWHATLNGPLNGLRGVQ